MIQIRFARCPVIGKRCYSTEELAKTAAKQFKKTFGSKMNSYYHDDCQSWHIGHEWKQRRFLRLHGMV